MQNLGAQALTNRFWSRNTLLDSTCHVLLLLLLLRSLVVLVIAQHNGIPSDANRHTDFHIYYDAAERLKEGKPIYSLTPFNGYVYSPFLAVVLRPITHLSVDRAVRVWFDVSCFSAAASAFVYAIAAGIAIFDFPRIALLLLLIFNAMPVGNDFSWGQADLVLLLIVAAIYLADAHKLYHVIALLIVLGALVKTWMLGFGVYLLLRKQWRSVVICAVAYAISMCALFSFIGWRELSHFVAVTRAYAVQPQLVMYSLAGFARLQFSENRIILPVASGRLPYWTFLTIGYVLVLLALSSILRSRVPASAYQRRLELGLTILSVLLLMPMCQAEYFILCLPLFADLLISNGPDRPYRGGFTTVIVVLAYVVYTRSWPRFAPIPSQFQRFPRSLEVSAYFFAFVAVGVMTHFAIRRERQFTTPAVEIPL